MKKITLLFLAFSIGIFTMQAQFTFPTIDGPVNVLAGTPVTIDLNDAANASGVPAGQYGSFTITADWTAGGGGPWSSEAELQVTTQAGVADVDPPTAGAAFNGDATTLTFSAGLAGIYDPSVDASLSITLSQSFGGSDADFTNISVTFEPFVAPPLPSTVATLNVDGCFDSDSNSSAYDASVESIVWVEVVYDGTCSALIADTEGSDFDTEVGIYDADGFLIGSNDDGGTGALSLFSAAGLGAGTYYVAAGRFNVTFGAGFAVTSSNSTQTGNLTITASTPPPPPPTTVGTLTLDGCGATDSFTNAAFDAAVDGVVWLQLDYDGNCFAATVDTETSDFDTEIGLYDSNGERVGNNDDGGTGTLSSFTEIDLAAGTYYIAAGGFNMVFGDSGFDVTTTSTGTGSLTVNASTPTVPTAPTTVATLALNGCDALDTYSNPAFDAAVDGVVWLQLDYDGTCFEATVDTEGSDFDTEIGLYDSNGVRIGNNDDGGTGTLSSFTEEDLAAGTYYIAVGGFNIVFGALDFDVTTTSTQTGSLNVNASTPTENTVDFANLQFPNSGDITTGDSFDVFAQVFEAGVTEPAGQGADIEAWIGYNTTDATTTADFETGWTWIEATYNTDNNNNDEYTAEIGSGLDQNTYFYVSRFRIEGGPFSYGGINPGGSDGNFWDGTNFISGVLTVTDPPPPANDLFADAIAIACGDSVLGTTISATLDESDAPSDTTVEPNTGADVDSPWVWYSFTGSGAPEIVTLSTCGTDNTDFDTELFVYTGTSGALTLIDDGFDECGGSAENFAAETSFTSDGTTTYYVAVGGWNVDDVGNFQLNVSCETVCLADAGTLTIDADPVTISGGTATVSATPDGNINVPTDYDVVYVLTSGPTLIIEQTSLVAASFDVTIPGDYTLHTLVAEVTDDTDPNYLDLSVVVPGTTTGGDVIDIVTNAGLCASLDAAGAPVTVLEECTADAGTLTIDADPVTLSGGSATVSATPDGNINVPTDYDVVYVLTSGPTLIIEQTSLTSASFDVTAAGDYTLHTLVAEVTDDTDPNFLDLSVVVPGTTTGGDVIAIITNGGLCASLDAAGAPVTVLEECTADAGTLTIDADPVTLSGGSATVSATPDGNINVPTDYDVVYVLTSGPTLIIEQTSLTSASFDVTAAGDYTLHTLVAEVTDDTDPNFLDLSVVVPGTTTGGDVIAIITNGGLCASLDAAGAPVTVEDPLSIGDLDNESAFTYFPNPVKNKLTINAQNSIEKVIMYNMLGQKVMQILPNTVDSEIDMSNFEAGAYFVQITIANAIQTFRVIKD